jgi:hypothetical protein
VQLGREQDVLPGGGNLRWDGRGRLSHRWRDARAVGSV